MRVLVINVAQCEFPGERGILGGGVQLGLLYLQCYSRLDTKKSLPYPRLTIFQKLYLYNTDQFPGK